MKLTDNYDGSAVPFEGDRTLLWTSLPAGAKVSKATLSLAPVGPPGGTLFQEEIRFPINQGDWGATKVVGANGNPYVEIDFHKPRTLVSVDQKGLIGASMQIDLGGVFVEINDAGAIKTPTDPNKFPLPAPGATGSSALPGLTVSKFRLIATGAGSVDVTRVVVRSVPSNINVRLGKMGAFWPRPGDLTTTDSSPDFTDVLRVFLNTAEIKNGFYVIPLVIHSDTIARFKAQLQVEYIQQASIMPNGISEVVLPFDFGSLPRANPDVLKVDLPSNARVVAGDTTAKVLGAFDETRVIAGPTGQAPVAGNVPVSPDVSQAQLFTLDAASTVSAIDIFITPEPPGVTLGVDLRMDLDGKPDAVSLLSKPAQVTVPSQANGQPSWINIPLGQQVHLQARQQARYWLVIQSLVGQADWSVQPTTDRKPVMQQTQDGALSWRETPAPPAASPPSGLFRLRTVPATFQVPIDLQVGAGNQAQRVKLDRYQPLGRIDFALNVPEVADGFNSYLAAAPAGCNTAELLANGDFHQLAVVGNDPGDLTRVPLISGRVGAVTVSSDGNTVYVGMIRPHSLNNPDQTLLLRLDVVCNRLTTLPATIPAFDLPKTILLYPDQTKALVIGSVSTIALLDLVRGSVIKSNAQFSVTSMCLTTDGGSVVFLIPDGSELGAGSIVASLTVAEFEQSLSAPLSGTNLDGPPVAVAIDRNRLYALTAAFGAATAGKLFFIDPQTLQVDGDPVATAPHPLALAVTPDGRHVVIANSDNSVTIVDVQHRTTTLLRLGAHPVPSLAQVVISPDSQHAFIAIIHDTAAGFAVTIVDLTKRSIIDSVPTSIGLTSIAITPQGDQLYVGTDGGVPLSYLPLGVRVPGDWFLTSGEILIACVPQQTGTRLVAVLGEKESPQPNALSQVVPISGGCTYDFSFEGLTNDPNAVAEVLWRGQDCGGVKTDSVPIPLLMITPKQQPIPPPVPGAVESPTLAISNRQVQLVNAGARLTAPTGATSAEVRFSVPDGAAFVAMSSLKGASQALVNSNLESAQSGKAPDQWTLSPATAQGFITSKSGSVTVLRNTGPNTADLVQTIPVTADKPFSLEFLGHALTTTPNAAPGVILHWLKNDGSVAGPDLTEEIVSATFESHPMSGQVPTQASQVEVHLSLPSGTALAVDEISLRMPTLTSVPVSFVAQSPGQLRVSGAQVAYDTVPPSPPPVPAGGLCPPTPPGQKPGQQPSGSGYCSCCESQSQMVKPTPAVTPAGRPMTVGACSDCGNQIVTGGGALVKGVSQPLTLRVVPPHTPAPSEIFASTRTPIPGLTLVQGIGNARAKHLKRAGIKSIRELAKADPDYVAQALRGVSPKNAAQLVKHAQELLTANT